MTTSMLGKTTAVFALAALPLSVSLWHKSHHNAEAYRFDVTLYKSLNIYLKDGVCGLRLLNLPTKTASRSEFRSKLVYDATPERRSLLWRSTRKGPYRITWLVFPFWLATGGLTLVGAMPIVRGPLRTRWRRYYGRCEECGYDLRGSRGRRCPECGEFFRRTKRIRSNRRPETRSAN